MGKGLVAMMLALMPLPEDTSWARFTKRVMSDGRVMPARIGEYFHAQELPEADSPEEAFAMLEGLRGLANVMLVRGRLKRESVKAVARRYLGQDAQIVASPRRLVLYDFDDLADSLSPLEALAKAVHRLPPSLCAGKFWGVATAKAKPGAMRMRVASLLASPASDRSLRKELTGICDVSLFSPVQPHYTADPDFDCRDMDPFLYGRSARLTLPGEAALTEQADLAMEAKRILDRGVKKIASAKEGDRHRVLNRWVYEIARYSSALPADAPNRIYHACIESGLPPDRAKDEIGRAWSDGAKKPIVQSEGWKAALMRDERGILQNTEVNARTLFQFDHNWRDRVGFAVNSHSVEWLDPPKGVRARVVQQYHLGTAQEDFAREYGVAFPVNRLYSALECVSMEQPFDAKREWLDSQPYDGNNYVEPFLSYVLKQPRSAYLDGVSRELFLGIARRVLEPGCQHDSIVVLEGPEGIGKSSLWRAIGKKWHAEIRDLTSDDYVLFLQRAILAELAELAALRRSDEERFKSLATATTDIYRPKYARQAVNIPRQCVFVGTTNKSQYLAGKDGNRRFLPVWCENVDLHVARSIASLALGEARERVKSGEVWTPIQQAREQQAARELDDPWVDTLAHILSTRDRATLADITALIEADPSRRTPFTYERIRKCLPLIGWQEMNRKEWRNGRDK